MVVTWVPLAVAALSTGHFLEGVTAEPFLHHFGLNVKLLVAVPVLIAGEALLERLTRKKIPHFVESGLVTEADRSAAGLHRARTHLALAARAARGPPRGVSRLPLSLVATHSDRAGGPGFLSELPYAFSPLTLGLSTVLAAEWGHAALYHATELESFTLPLVAFTIVTTAVVLAPLLAFVGPLVALRRREKLRYGALVGEYGRLVPLIAVEMHLVDALKFALATFK